MKDAKWEKAIKDHKNDRYEEIINATLEICAEHDISKITMKGIGAKVGISRVTLYKYFDSLDDIFFELQMRIMSDLGEYIDSRVQNECTSIDKLRAYLQAMLDFFQDNKELIKFIGFFDYYYRDVYPTKDLEKKYRVFLDENSQLNSIIEQGKEEGTIKKNADSNIIAEFISQTTMALIQRLAIRGHLISKMRQIDPNDILNEFFSMISMYIETGDRNLKVSD